MNKKNVELINVLTQNFSWLKKIIKAKTTRRRISD